MNIVYRLIGTKEYKKVYVRLYHNKLSVPAPTELIAKTENWNPDQELFNKNKPANEKLIRLKINIEDAFNRDYSTGVIINSKWLKDIIKQTFLRPNAEEKLINHKSTMFLYDFGLEWLEKDVLSWRNSSSNLLNNKEKNQKLKALEQFNNFQQKEKTEIKLTDFDSSQIEAFYHYLISENYASSTAKKTLSEIKFFCKRADAKKININQDYKSTIIFKDKSEKIDSIYLDDNEITAIFNYDFKNDELKDIMRDNFILNLWTGFRISDLKKISLDNFIGKNVESTSIKTNTLAVVPIHPQVNAILQKRFGNLPPKVNKDEYNIEIKEICRLCKIDAPTKGKLFDPEKNRKITGIYPKYKLVSSHTARRSFGTNLSKVLTKSEVAKLGGWKDINTVDIYDKRESLEIAEKVDYIWNSK